MSGVSFRSMVPTGSKNAYLQWQLRKSAGEVSSYAPQLANSLIPKEDKTKGYYARRNGEEAAAPTKERKQGKG